VTLLNKDKRQVTKQKTVTRNIGESGASIVCSLEAKPGDTVKFACKAVNFYAMAVVRNRRQLAGAPATLHVEFIESSFPVEKLRLDYDSAGAEKQLTAEPEPTSEQAEGADQLGDFEIDRF
jgi:hypothetical protein